jgi:hypothetical protein
MTRNAPIGYIFISYPMSYVLAAAHAKQLEQCCGSEQPVIRGIKAQLRGEGSLLRKLKLLMSIL